MMEAPTVEIRPNPNLLADEESAICYASGFVGMKLLKQFKKCDTVKATQFRECLSKMARNDVESSFLDYTKEWIRAVNREGL